MAGEIFIARQDTLEAVQQTVNQIDTNVDTVNTTTTNTKAETANIKTDTDGLKLSTDSIKQIADTILERIGLTTDVGGANTGTVLGKLNALFSSGGGISGFKYTQKTKSFTYKTQSSGIVIGRCYGKYSSSNPRITITNGSVIDIVKANTSTAYQTDFNFLGAFAEGATITGDDDNEYINCGIFEFI